MSYFISVRTLAEQIAVQDYRTAQTVARSLCLALNEDARIYELVAKLDGTPELLMVCHYTALTQHELNTALGVNQK